ncbi:ADP-ribosyl cyclase/cyclic ADP-ribose hydrolase 1-like [Pelmatolapia mariae]|uniref:ADP-ribosyl cyclase/cyclic ADP-ribose hydrolase 1-like n=1 Tax=Pelmatolapia mariae TaxID=158779 RepID=UPI002FE5E6E6
MEQEQEEQEETPRPWNRILSAIIVLIIVIIGAVLGPILQTNKSDPKSTFLSRCKKFNQYDCQRLWDAFEQAYVNKDPCNVPVEAYNALIAAAPFKPQCNKMMFWSKTKDVVHGFTAKRKDCFATLEDTLLGYALNGLTWCGKEGSNDTFTTGCPRKCENNPVDSFWKRASAAYADVACGDVTAMLSGSTTTPFDPTSTFARVEVTRFKAPKVRSLNVVMVIQKNAK